MLAGSPFQETQTLSHFKPIFISQNPKILLACCLSPIFVPQNQRKTPKSKKDTKIKENKAQENDSDQKLTLGIEQLKSILKIHREFITSNLKIIPFI